MIGKIDIVGWYIKNIIVPNFVKYENPGFVITEQKSKYGHTFQRDIFLSERFISNIETKIINNLGMEGKKFLYSVGKSFGWNYGKSFKVPTIKEYPEKEVLEAANFLANFVGGTWAENTEINVISVEKKYFEISFIGYVVCRLNGTGILLTEGGLAGLWSWMMDDQKINGVQVKCEGRHDAECRCICSPSDLLIGQGISVIEDNEILETDSDTQEYRNFNKIRPINFSKNSMKQLITSGIVKYRKGRMEYGGTRYFPLGIDFLFILEKKTSENNKINEIIIQASFEEGISIAKEQKTANQQTVSDILSSQGWGDILLSKDYQKIVIQFYPWHPLYQSSKKQIFIGVVSGLVTEIRKKNTKYAIKSESLMSGFVSMELKAND